MTLKTSQEVRADFEKNGVSIRSWAEANGFKRMAVYQVLSGRIKAQYGIAHQIAVALGLKDGVAGMTPQTYLPVAKTKAKAKAVKS